jgi:hypothetical protein
MPGDETQIVAKAGAEAVFAPVRDFFNRLLGPAADELGGILADPIRMYRFKRSVRLLEKVKRFCSETGFEPKSVPLKILLPILENASLEDDEDLRDRWANLLANATMPEGKTHPSFVQVLEGLTSLEAKFLSAIFDQISLQIEEHDRSPNAWTQRDLFRVGLGAELHRLYCHAVGISEDADISSKESAIALDNFRRLRLVDGPFPGRPHLELTPMGFAFAQAISKPPNAD